MERIKLTYNDVEQSKKGCTLLYHYIRGSHCYGLNTPTSDKDEGGVFISPIENILDLGLNYQDQISNDSNDIVYYELKKYMNLLLNSNPTMLESLFVDDEFVLYEHPWFKLIKENRDIFISQQCFGSFGGYAKTQIGKCRGQHKMFLLNPVEKRLSPLDFCYTFYNQGSTKIENWLSYRNLKQEYCGLVNIPNMHDVYGLYYDWGKHFKDENISYLDIARGFEDSHYKGITFKNMSNFIIYDILELQYFNVDALIKWYSSLKPIGYRGIICNEDEANELRLSSIPKGEESICNISYNATGYTKHCIDYKNYHKWLNERNPDRYENNKGKLYDRKNVCHAFRLLNMAIEIAEGKGMLVNRRDIDRDFLLDIKHGNRTYEEVMELLEEKKKVMDEAFKNSIIPLYPDKDKVNDIMLEIRKLQLEEYGKK